jgi:hypothetical protein
MVRPRRSDTRTEDDSDKRQKKRINWGQSRQAIASAVATRPTVAAETTATTRMRTSRVIVCIPSPRKNETRPTAYKSTSPPSNSPLLSTLRIARTTFTCHPKSSRHRALLVCRQGEQEPSAASAATDLWALCSSRHGVSHFQRCRSGTATICSSPLFSFSLTQRPGHVDRHRAWTVRCARPVS